MTAAPWQKTFLAFAGPGMHYPSDSMRVTDEEAIVLQAELVGQTWSDPVYEGGGRHAGYLIRHAQGLCATALFGAEGIAGFYSGSYLWIAPAHRGRGLSTPLILAAAERRGGSILPPGVVVLGYSRSGLAAHRAAHAHAVLSAVEQGLPVPEAVLSELRASHPVAQAA